MRIIPAWGKQDVLPISQKQNGPVSRQGRFVSSDQSDQ
jgi:hypothetical protein